MCRKRGKPCRADGSDEGGCQRAAPACRDGDRCGVGTDRPGGCVERHGSVALRDPTSLRHQKPQLYLEPITRTIPTSEPAAEADATYRLVRADWHKHLTLAEATQAHPYQLPASPKLVQAMQQLRNQPELATNAQQALDGLLNDHTSFQNDREHIQTYQADASHAWKRHKSLQEIAREFTSQNIRLEDNDSYTKWKERALRLADAGEDILADQKRYSIHLDRRPDSTQRIREHVKRLNATLGREEASIRRQRQQSLSESEKTGKRCGRHHSMKL